MGVVAPGEKKTLVLCPSTLLVLQLAINFYVVQILT